MKHTCILISPVQDCVTFLNSRIILGICDSSIEQYCFVPSLRIEKFLGYTSDELLGKSVYSYFDARDISALQKDFKTCKCVECFY